MLTLLFLHSCVSHFRLPNDAPPQFNTTIELGVGELSGAALGIDLALEFQHPKRAHLHK